jgi:hypothetical protein
MVLVPKVCTLVRRRPSRSRTPWAIRSWVWPTWPSALRRRSRPSWGTWRDGGGDFMRRRGQASEGGGLRTIRSWSRRMVGEERVKHPMWRECIRHCTLAITTWKQVIQFADTIQTTKCMPKICYMCVGVPTACVFDSLNPW